MENLKLGEAIVYVGGGQFQGDVQLANGHTLCVGAEGIITSIIEDKHELRCSFGRCFVQLSAADVRIPTFCEPSPPSSRRQSSENLAGSALNCCVGKPSFVEKIRLQTAGSRRASNESSRRASHESSRRASHESAHSNIGVPYRSPAVKPPAVPRSGCSARSRNTCMTPRVQTSESTRSPSRSQHATVAGAAVIEVHKPRDDQPETMKTFRKVSLATGMEWEPDKQHPPSFYCPISKQCMHDPVVLTDGHTYERRHIEQWLKNNNTSPVSGALLSEKMLFPNHALRNSIEEYFEQVLGGHRSAIRHTISGLRRQGDFASDAVLLQTIDSLMQCSVLMNADLCIERVLKSIMHEAKSLVGAEVASVFLVDKERNELYSTVNSTGKELRIPLRSGIAGRVASSGKPLIIRDAYCDARFNTAVDDKTGFKTHNIMCVPIKARKHGVIGVAQLINKTNTGVLVHDSNSNTSESTQSCEFNVDDQHFLQLLASQAAVAIMNSGAFDLEVGLMDPVATPRASTWPQIPSDQEGRGPPREECIKAVTIKDIDSSVSDCIKAKDVDAGLKAQPEELPALDRLLLQPFLDMAKHSWETDVLDLAELSCNRPLSTLTEYLFHENQLVSFFGLDAQKLSRFLIAIENGYLVEVPYHNRAHATSVVHFMHSLLFQGGLADVVCGALGWSADQERSRLLVGMAGLIAACVHDYDHLGFNNDYLSKTRNERAVRYNDRNVNENHHVSAAFEVLLRPDCNFLDVLPADEFRRIRGLIIDLVLATDMNENQKVSEKFKANLVASQEDQQNKRSVVPQSPGDAVLSLQMALKCADLGHLALSWPSHLRWVKRLEAEFFAQGDSEKKLGMGPVSFLMDRDKPGVSTSQTGFFDFVALPLFSAYVSAFPSATPMMSAVNANYARWTSIEAKAKAEGTCRAAGEPTSPGVTRRISR